MITAGRDGCLRTWDSDYFEAVESFYDPNRMCLNDIMVSPSGKFLAVCGDDFLLKVYDIATAQPQLIAVGTGHCNIARSLSWSPDEKQILTVGDDSCICVWNFFLAETGSGEKK